MQGKDLLKNEKRNSKSTKYIKIGVILGFVFSVIASFWTATQLFAKDFGYWKGFYNEEIFSHIYYPWAILTWYFKYGEAQGQYFKNSLIYGQATFCMTFLFVVIVASAIRSKLKGIETLHGSARWATIDEIKDTGLMNDVHNGKPYVYVGGYVDKKGVMHYLTHSGPEHVLCYAPTRSGKGVGLVIPTLVEWNASAVITDLKGELWALTSGYRKTKLNQKVIRFEPAIKGSAKWNPLSEIRIGTEFEVGDAQNLANMIVDPDGKGLDGQDGHWKKTAFALYTSLILHVLYKQKNGDLKEIASLRTIDNILSDPTRETKELWEEMMTYKHLGDRPHPVISNGAKDQYDRPDEEAGSVLSTVKSYLSLYRDPIVSENTSESTFKIQDIMNFDVPLSVYVVTQPSDKTRLKPLIRIFVNMVVRILASKMKFEKGRAVSCNKHRLLMMLDEFPSLGKLEIMQESLAFVAGYGIKCYLITQDLSQLKNDYGQNESITSNCHIQNAYPPNRMETAEYLSKMTGQTTIVKKSVTKSGKGLNISSSVTMQEVQRALLTPDECMRLKGAKKAPNGDIKESGDMLIFVAGYPAIYGRQILYFQDKYFLDRTLIPAPEKSDSLEEKHINSKFKLTEKDLFPKETKSEEEQLEIIAEDKQEDEKENKSEQNTPF